MKTHDAHEFLSNMDVKGKLTLKSGINTGISTANTLNVNSLGDVYEGDELLTTITNGTTAETVGDRENLYTGTTDTVAQFRELVAKEPLIISDTSDLRGAVLEIKDSGVTNPNLDSLEPNGSLTYPDSSAFPFGSASQASPLIYQWGKLDVVTHSSNEADQVVKFPKPFPNELLEVSIQDVTAGGNSFESRINGTLPTNPDFDTLEASRPYFNPTLEGFCVFPQQLAGGGSDETSYKTWMAIGR